MKRNTLTIVIGAVLVVIFALLLFVFQVRQSETAVVATFGKPVATYTNAGAYFKIPWPIQKVYKYDQRVQNFEDKFSQTLTADNNMLLTSVYVGWKISDAGQFLQVFPGDPSVSLPNAQSKLEGMLRTAKSAVIGGHPLSDFVNADPQALKFDAIENEIEQSVQNELRTNNYGIELEFLGFKKIGLPESVTQTVFDAHEIRAAGAHQPRGKHRQIGGAENPVRRRRRGRQDHRQRAGHRDAHPRRGRGRGRENAADIRAESRPGGFPPAH